MTDEVPLEVDCQSVRAKLEHGEDFLLVDCREQDEWNQVHLDAARLVPMSELANRLAELEAYRDKPITIHCHHGGRSLRVARWLRQQGFAQAQSMAGGIDRWALEIDPSLPRY
jgi:rhodanese-related sulfurtransferase